ncbi:nucleotide pyrophosphohydrolase [Candidatus Peregrinibacteria bacterium]|nr:nucleotide pyrophosphohydrolase [Candidatus Peregrinibacteria bacterium]
MHFSKLVDLAARLRSKNGCPWDKKQTIDSMLEHFLEEAAEVKIAMKKHDHKNLREELGDLIFTMIMIAQIAKEKKKFDMRDVLADIHKKIRRRHTWVFGKHKACSAEHALEMWRKNKRKEKRSKRSDKQ